MKLSLKSPADMQLSDLKANILAIYSILMGLSFPSMTIKRAS
jgi:hypothetical protein